MKRIYPLALPLLFALGIVTATAADIKVLTAGAYKPVILALQADFEAQTGIASRLKTTPPGPCSAASWPVRPLTCW